MGSPRSLLGTALLLVAPALWADVPPNAQIAIEHAQNVFAPEGAGYSRANIDAFWARQDVSYADWACVGAAKDYSARMIETDGWSQPGYKTLPEGTVIQNITTEVALGVGHTTSLISVPDGQGGLRHYMADDYLGFVQVEEMVPTQGVNPLNNQWEVGYRFRNPIERQLGIVNGEPISGWGGLDTGTPWYVNDNPGMVNKVKVNGQWVDLADPGNLHSPYRPFGSIPEGKETTLTVGTRESVDPNMKTGPVGAAATGADPAGTTYDGGYLQGVQPFVYNILFENLVSATAPAQQVLVTDALDPATLDAASVQLGPISLLGQTLTPPPNDPAVFFYVGYLDLRPDRHLVVRVKAGAPPPGILRWEFITLNPDTPGCDAADLGCLEPVDPADPFSGFLAPGEGGSVSFLVQLQPGLPDAAPIGNAALIQFDGHLAGPVIPTNFWINRLDRVPPASSVQAMPAQQGAVDFDVTWAGVDTASGIQDYSVYASVGGGPYLPWLSGVKVTQARFAGAHGQSYRFYSIARDRAGNLEAAPGAPDATTSTPPEAPPPAIPGDLDGDGDVDRNDLNILLAARNIPVAAGDPRDLDGDGVVTVLDGRKLVLLCTRPRCATL